MQKISRRILLSDILCMVLIAVIALSVCSCSAKEKVEDKKENNVSGEAIVMGEGEKSFTLTVVDADGNETRFKVNTDRETVGEALLELGLIDGDESEFGLYIKTVNGITVDYDVDGKYWAFYVNGEYAMAGADTTEITEGAEYSFKVE